MTLHIPLFRWNQRHSP